MSYIPLHDHVALLIDADNAQLTYIEQVLEISEYYGQLTIRRAYGDWKEARLSSWSDKLDTLNIERIQVDRIAKNATDHRLLMEAGEILGAASWETDVYVFVIVSGDGDFTIPCKVIQEKGRHVIGIGNKNKTAPILRASCDKFYYLENLDDKLRRLNKLHPIPPREVRGFFNLLFFAYHYFTKADWVSYSQLGAKLRDLSPDYDCKFGKNSLSTWLIVTHIF